jgi:LPS sulfotransferase NodH
VLGAPAEYVNLYIISKLYERLQAISMLDYWHKVSRLRTSPNGVFGFKMFPRGLMTTAKEHPGLLKKLRSENVIYLKRNDKIAQAVSFVQFRLHNRDNPGYRG